MSFEFLGLKYQKGGTNSPIYAHCPSSNHANLRNNFKKKYLPK